MKKQNVSVLVRAWRDDEYFAELTRDDQAALPENPAGETRFRVVGPVECRSTLISDTCSTLISDCCSTLISNTCSTLISDCC